MRTFAVALTLATALLTSACSYGYYALSGEGLTVPAYGRAVSSVSQDAGLSLSAGAAPGIGGGFFYDWSRRNTEQQLQAEARRERELQLQAGNAP